MSESPAFVPPFARSTRESEHALRAERDDADSDLDDDDGDTGVDVDDVDDVDPAVSQAAPLRVREGLPPSYRMRADAHYVDALVERSLAAFDPPAPPTAAVSSVATVTSAVPGDALPPITPAAAPVPPAAVAPASPALTTALTASAVALAEAFDAIQSALRDVPLRGRPLRDRVAIELARAEATRGRWLADAAVVLQVEPLPALDEVDLLQLLTQVFDALGPENRLSGGAAALPVPEGACRVFGDERLLTTALGALLAAMRSLIEDRGDARKLAVALGPRREAATRTLEISQTAVRLPAAAYGRFFEADWDDHPAGASAALLLAAARKIASAHGGALEIGALDGGGCRLVLSLPAAD